jgi:hypothetical protein
MCYLLILNKDYEIFDAVGEAFDVRVFVQEF